MQKIKLCLSCIIHRSIVRDACIFMSLEIYSLNWSDTSSVSILSFCQILSLHEILYRQKYTSHNKVIVGCDNKPSDTKNLQKKECNVLGGHVCVCVCVYMYVSFFIPA